MERDDHPYEHLIVVGFHGQQRDRPAPLDESLGGHVIHERVTFHGGEIEYRSRWGRLLERLHVIPPA